MRTNQLINLTFILLLIAALVVLTSFIPFTSPAGYGDFQAYWSASYLLARAQNFTDLNLLLQVEQTQTGWTHDFVMSTWNPPWLLVLLIPFTWVSFDQAAWLWLFTTIGLVFAASLMAWQVFAAPKDESKRGWLALLLAFLFVPTILALFVGQVNILVYFGLAGFLFFYKQDKPFAAGVVLSLTLVKPHLVYIVLPITLLMAAREGRWRVWWGLGAAILLLTGIAFRLRPMFIQDYGRTVGSSYLLSWQTPTLGGILTALLGWDWSKWMGTAVLPLILALWFWRPGRMTFLTWFNSTLLLSVMTAPFGWSYDTVVLLLPILQMACWAVTKQLGFRLGRWLIVVLVMLNLLLLGLRLRGINEVYYFWLPIAVAGLYVWAKQSSRHYLKTVVS